MIRNKSRQCIDKGLQYDNIEYKMQPATRGWTLIGAHTEVSTDSIGANIRDEAGGDFQQWDFAPQSFTHSMKPCLRQFHPVTIFRLRQLYSVVI